METTIVALKFEGGNIIGADTKRLHLDNGIVEIWRKLKFFKDTNICYGFAGHGEVGRCLMSGVTESINDIPQAEIDTETVAAAIKAEMERENANKEQGLFRNDTLLHCLVVGHDHIFQIDFHRAGTTLKGGDLEPELYAMSAIGSGGSAALEYLDRRFGQKIQNKVQISVDDATDGIIASLREAIQVDKANSKGPIDIVILGPEGQKAIQRFDVAEDKNVFITEDAVKAAEKIQRDQLKEHTKNVIMETKERAKQVREAKQAEQAKQ